MKKIITPFFVIFFAVFTAFGQSVTLTPSAGNQNSIELFGTYDKVPNFSGFRGGSTVGLAVNADIPLVSIRGFGHTGTSFPFGPSGGITITTAENFTPTANGTKIRFLTTQIGTTTLSEKMIISDRGNVGIGTSTPGFPLNFANTIGDKISLWGQTGNHFGLGVDNSLMMIHTDLVGSDIAFGHGAFGAFTETMRIKGNGNLGIGTNDPQAKLHVNGTSILSTTPGTGEQVLIGESASGDSKVSIKSNGYQYGLKVEGSGSTAVGLAVTGGGASIEGNSQFGNNLTVLQAFTSQGSATFEGASNFNNNATFNAPAAFIQNVSMQNLSVNNITPTASAVNIQGNLSTTNNSDVNGFSKLGSDSPAIKVKKLTGTTAGTQLGTATITHGLARSKILSCSVLVDNGTYSTPPNSTFTNVRYTFDIDDVNIVIYNSSTTDAQQHNKPIVILVTYEQ